MDKKPLVNIFWFRRDLRVDDNAGLYHALKSGNPVLPLFIFDTNILAELEDRADARVAFIYQALENIQQQLLKLGSSLQVFYGTPLDIFGKLLKEYSVGTIFMNRDYEPYARQRDAAVEKLAADSSSGFRSFKDQVIFETSEVTKDDGKPYTVFTPYSRVWKARLNEFQLRSYPVSQYDRNFYQQEPFVFPSLQEMGFEPTTLSFPSRAWDEDILRHYKEQRDTPGSKGTSRLSVHLRFGTISIRKLASVANTLSETYLNELIWREFYQMILWHFPQVVDHAFKPAYDKIPWRNHEKEFEAWAKGETGYPIVDAGMRELNTTGLMHNRVRMIVASFLTKHLLIDWRWGEAYFARKLLDYDLAANNGGWQWAAGSGCDAAPYFRIFNPSLQTKKFDPDLVYVRSWVPELEELTYPTPIVEHEVARKRCLAVYSAALQK